MVDSGGPAMSDPVSWLVAVRHSHERLVSLVAELGPGDLARASACGDWCVAQVLSHLGSQAEIFSLFVDAGLSGNDPPSRGAFGPIWDIWNTRTPRDQATESRKSNEALVSRLEGLDPETLGVFRLEVFGRSLDAAGLLRMRLSEHAVHTWDIASAFDPSAVVAEDAVALLLAGLGETVARSAVAPGEPLDATVITTAPDRRFSLRSRDSVVLEQTGGATVTSPSIEMTAEAFLRLVYGRLDDNHPTRRPVHANGISIAELTTMFPGF